MEQQEQENKEQKFIRIPEYRMTKAIKAVESLKALSNKGAYHCTEEQVNAMFSTLENTVADVKSAFRPKKAKSAFSFVDSEGGMSYESQQ